MAKFDAYLSSFIWTKLFPSILVITILICLWLKRKTIRLLYQNWLQTKDWPHKFEDLNPSYKENLFTRLKLVRSGDFDLRNRGLVRILEVGVGHGKNFQYLPLNCQLIVAEPNRFTRPEFTRNLKKFPLVKLIKYVETTAENLSSLQDNSVDIVVACGCLCTCEMGVSLSEISRVLHHNGIFVYMEHTISPEKRIKNLLIKLINPAWKFIYGCNISHNLPVNLRKHFNSVCYEVIKNHNYFLDTIIVGSAMK